MNKSSSTIVFQDITQLEKDFVSNLLLLKLRKSEIDRCKKTNALLQETYQTAMNEIQLIKIKYLDLKNKLLLSEKTHQTEIREYQHRVMELESKVKDMKGDENKSLEKLYLELQGREEEIVKKHEEFSEQQRKNYLENLEKLQTTLNKNEKNIEHLKGRLQTVTQDNINLHGKIKSMEKDKTHDISYFKTECEQLQKKYSTLEKELKNTRDDNSELKANANNLIQLNKTLKQKLSEEAFQIKEKLAVSAKKIDTLIAENRKLAENSERDKQKIKSLTEENSVLHESNRELSDKIEKFEEKTKNLDAFSGNALEVLQTIPEENHLEKVTLQNRMLQMIIKDMRRKRLSAESHAQERIENLESLVHNLKQNMMIKKDGIKEKPKKRGRLSGIPRSTAELLKHVKTS